MRSPLPSTLPAEYREKNSPCAFQPFPIGDVRDIHASAHHVFQAGTRVLERALDVLQGLHRLGIYIAPADNLPSAPVAVVPDTWIYEPNLHRKE